MQIMNEPSVRVEVSSEWVYVRFQDGSGPAYAIEGRFSHQNAQNLAYAILRDLPEDMPEDETNHGPLPVQHWHGEQENLT